MTNSLMRTFLRGFAILLASVVVVRADPLEVWVDDDWTNAVPGDVVAGHTFGTDAFGSIQPSLNAVASNGVVHVAPGLYGDEVHFPGKPMIVRSDAGPATTTIRIQFFGDAVIFDGGEGPDSVLDGFTIGTGGRFSACVRCTLSSPTIVNNIFDSSVDYVVYLDRSAAVITNNTFAGTAGRPIDASTSSPWIVDNYINAASGEAIWLSGGTLAQPFKISANTVLGRVYAFGMTQTQIEHEVSNNFIGQGMLYTDFTGQDGLRVVNNTLAGTGFLLNRGSSRVRLINNIVTNPYELSIYDGYGEIANNNFWPAGTLHSLVGSNANISIDPVFVDEANGDYHLAPLSPCLGTGRRADAPPFDLEGIPRPSPISSRPDMGAYESQWRFDHYFGVGLQDLQRYTNQHLPGWLEEKTTASIDDVTFPDLCYVVEDTAGGQFASRSWYRIKQGQLGLYQVQTSEGTTVFDEPIPTVAYQPKVKDVYTISTGAHSDSASFTVQSSTRVMKLETITVPAGTFECFRLKNKMVLKPLSFKGKPSKVASTVWFAPNVGILRTKTRRNDTVLAEYFVGAPSSP